MGSPISATVANIVMGHLENNVLNSLGREIKFYKRYVDDCLVLINKGRENLILDTFNAFNSHLQFTIEEEKEDKIAFLDLLIIRKNRIIINLFKKNTHTGRYWDFNSLHTNNQKKGLIKSLIFRCLTLPNNENGRNLAVRETSLDLINNGFPIKLIEKCINEVKAKIAANIPKLDFDMNNCVVLNYVDENSYKIKNCLSKFNIKTIFKPINTVQYFLPKYKDTNAIVRNAIYRIKCNDCNREYVGQTKQYLTERLGQHKKALEKDIEKNSTLVTHRHNTNHNNFDFGNVKIISIENNYFIRLLKESYFIKKTNNPLNRNFELGSFPEVYLNIKT